MAARKLKSTVVLVQENPSEYEEASASFATIPAFIEFARNNFDEMDFLKIPKRSTIENALKYKGFWKPRNEDFFLVRNYIIRKEDLI